MRRVGSDATTPQTAEEVTARVAAEPRACDGDSEERIKRVVMSCLCFYVFREFLVSLGLSRWALMYVKG